MSTPKIAACLIVKGTKDEAPLLDACLKSLNGHVDKHFLDINAPKGQEISKEVLAVAKKHKADYVETVWEGNFVKARNDNFARVPKEYDFIIWADTDDTVTNPEKIRPVCAVVPEQVDGIYIKYNYDHDEYDNVTVALWVARVVRNNGSFSWKSSFADDGVTVHETLNEIRRGIGKVMNEEFWFEHHADEERRDRSLERNIRLLEGMLKRTMSNPDARILYYLATHYVDANRIERAKELFEWYLKLSGWAEERSQAWVYLGMIYDAYQDTSAARGCYMRAVAENPNDPNPYVELGELEIKDRNFQKAVYWLEMAVNKKLDPMATVLRPMDSTYRAYKLLSQAYVNIGGKSLQKAQKWLTEAKKLRPYDPEIEQAQAILDEIKHTRAITKATNQLLAQFKKDEQTDKIVPFLDTLPTTLQDNPLVTSARNYYTPPKKWAKNSIAILAGWGPLGNWGPKSLEKGLGGSEEAIIRLSRELSAMGYKVTVFGTPGEEAGLDTNTNGSYFTKKVYVEAQSNGRIKTTDVPDTEKQYCVEYKHYWELNTKDEFDIFISWRNQGPFDKPLKARKKYLWLHDVIEKEELTETRLANLDKIIFVSQYHRNLYPFVPEDKCFVSGNGISPEEFEAMDGKFERDPHRVIYMSSHVRGLQLIYEVWPDVLKKVTNAKLDIYYGWDSYISVNKDNPERMAWMEKMQQWANELDGVTDHGKIGHAQIAEEIQKSGVWAYPCPFPEVYCITAVKAQAGGAVPVASSFAALDETVKYGTKLPMQQQNEKTPVGQWNQEELESFKDALIDMLQHPEKQEAVRKEMMEWARREMTWEKTAKGWSDEFSR